MKQWNQLFEPYETLIVALSGGVDSMALAHMLLTHPSLKQSIELVHFDHGLRDNSAQQAAELIRYFDEQQIEVHHERWKNPIGGEEAAREARYNFLSRVSKRYPKSTIVTAHHLNDQIETFFMKIMRKSTLKGLGGMSERSEWRDGKQAVPIVRPLLQVEKSTLVKYALTHHLPIFEDETNQEIKYERNWWRNILYPQIETRYARATQSFKEVMNDLKWTEEYVIGHMEKDLQEVVQWDANGLMIDIEKYHHLPISTQQLMWPFISDQLASRFQLMLSRKQTNQMQKMIANQHKPQTEMALSKPWIFMRQYEMAIITQADVAKKSNESKIERIRVQKAGRYRVGTLQVEVIEQQMTNQEVKQWQQHTLIVPLEDAPVILITYQPGDRLLFETNDDENKPRYHQKVSRYFINNKIPHAMRKQAILGENETGEKIGMIAHLTSKCKFSPKNRYLIFKVVE
ncbi:tRNA lysidine(34) synthetase TilS [Atopobacter phocae]|uniref:tRNA lysidine(34) synthetase TilS n=1 Tax=Atopobacter phocae TaxID=136492 RepID=UPI001FE0B55D|nr:tRNA lysidine(34) synthetase TilS [Atopobacter phocae]